MVDKNKQNSGEQVTGYNSGWEMWRDYKAMYGVVAAYCICLRYLKNHEQNENEPEQILRRQLLNAMISERSMSDVAVYRRSAGFAELRGKINIFENSETANLLCAVDIDDAMDACTYGDGWIDYKTALTALIFRHGMERLRFVLGCEVNYDSVYGRYPDEHYQWAREMNIHESFSRYGVRTRPEYLAGFITELRQTEQINKPLLVESGEQDWEVMDLRKELKTKADFYIAFYEQLALKGFQAFIAKDGENHIADICVNGKDAAHLTKTDGIVPNPRAEGVDAGIITAIREIAQSTALMFGICTEKPYDEEKHVQLPDGSYKLAEFNDTVLSCGFHPLLNYVFSTYKQSPETGEPDEQKTFYNKILAMQDFAVRSGLINEQQFFTNIELVMLHANLLKMRIMPGNDLTSQETLDLDAFIAKIENITPELAGLAMGFDCGIENDAELTEGVEQ